MVRQSDDSESLQIAHELSEMNYERYANGGNTRLANATREYVRALQEAALQYGEEHPALTVPDFMLAYHDNLSCDLYAV